MNCFSSLGNVIKAQLLQRKGVRLTSFGTFSLSKGNPVFILSNEMIKQFKLTFRQPLTVDNIPTTAINFAQVQSTTNIPRDAVEKIYSKFLTAMGRVIFEGRNILLTVNRVAEISFTNYEVKSEFIPDFIRMFKMDEVQKAKTVDDFRNIAKKTTQTLTLQQDYLSSNERMRQQDYSPIQTGLNIGGDSNDGFGRRGGNNANRPSSATRARNPITGAGMGGSELGSNNNSRPKSAGRLGNNNNNFRRPGSARSELSHASLSTNSLLHSPRSQASFGPSGGNQRGGARPNSASRGRPTNNNMNNNAVTDPRKIAAKALSTNVHDVIDKVRSKIVERGGSTGIRSISKLLSIMDNNGDKRLSKDEFHYGLRDYGINLTPTELEQVFLYFDRDQNGFIDITEFLVGLKGDLTPRRKSMVQLAFNLLDKDHSGEISIDEILAVYDLTWHPEVRAGRMTVKEAAKDFMATWERGSTKDGNITFEEFEDYYKEVSASIDDDDYFELMIRNAWRIAGGKGAAANTANRRVLVTNKDGSQAVKTVENELGMKDWKDQNEVRRRLGQNQVDRVNVDDIDRMDMHGQYEDMKDARRNRAVPQGRPSNPANQNNNNQRDRRGNAAQQSPQRREAWPEKNNNNQRRNGRERDEDDFPFAVPGAGDQDLPPSRGSGRGGGNAPPQNRPMSVTSNSYDILHRLLYSPPVNMELLCAKLQISSVTASPRLPQGAFMKK
jgi:Ca2+-binding EF-hand superfamily protein